MKAGPVLIALPLHTVSEKNTHEHWARGAGRKAAQRGIAKMATWIPCVPLRGKVVTVLLTRIAPHALDEGDNLSTALSAVRDGVADALGTTDRDPLVTWAYAQRRGAAREYGVEVRIERGGTNL